MSGYFHYHSKNQVLTAYYEISSKHGILTFSSSLWKKSTPQEHWNRRQENKNAFENFLNYKFSVLFKPFKQRNLKLDDVWLKNFIHKALTKYGRINKTVHCEIGDQAFKTIEECHLSRGHIYHPRKYIQRRNDEICMLSLLALIAMSILFQAFLTVLMSLLY